MLKKRIRLRTEELRLLNEILKTLTREDKTEKLLEKVLRIFYSFWSIEAGFIALKEENSGKLKVVSSFGFLPSEVEKAIYSKGEGITGLTYQLGIPLAAGGGELINKTGLIERLKTKKVIFLTAPIKVEDQTVGVLGIFKDLKGVKEKIERLLETLSVVGLVLGTFIRLKEKRDISFKLSEELLKQLTGRGSGEKYLFNLPSEGFKKVLRLAELYKDLELPLLIKGEPGVGKSVIAYFLLRASKYSEKPFEVIDTSETFPEVLEKEFYQKVEKAKNGTLLVKHIENLPLKLQGKLLELLKEKQFRLVATASGDLSDETYKGKFLKGLRLLLETFVIEVPPLSERREDIKPLVEFFVEKISSELGRETEISPQVVELFVKNPPKDNIWGLKRYITRLLTLLPDRQKITLEDAKLILPELFKENRTPASREISLLEENRKFADLLKEEEKEKILKALKESNYVKSKAAKLLGYTLRQLDYRLKKYGIDLKRLKNK